MGFNRITGSIPNEIGQLDGLTTLGLEHNFLQRTVPHSIRKLENLGELLLLGNQLSGRIPDIFGNLTKLFTLMLSINNFEGTIPISLKYCKGMQLLDISHNNLSGNIPKLTFGQLESIIHLDLSSNSLIGPIPSEIGNMKQLVELRLSENSFSGDIPMELGKCIQVTDLDMSGNFLHGTIPSSFSSLKSLVNLDLSNNNLSGTIPQQLKDLPILKTLNLSHNHFYGEVPKGGAFDNITAISLTGNEDLCGGIPQLKLPTCPRSFGSVYKGTLRHFEGFIAVKVLNLQAHGASKSFITECKTLSNVRHRNLLKILTSCSSVDYNGNDFKALVYEFMPNGSLENWLLANELDEPRDLHLNFEQRLDVAIYVAHALDYLHHGFEETIVHCEIKPSNVLLSDDMVAHLGDFGLARLLHEVTSYSSVGQTTSSAIKGTIGYIPLEYGESVQVTTKGDIYSYGILMLEMLTGKKPTYSMFREDLSLSKFCMLALPDRIFQIMDPNLLVLSDRDHRKIMQNSNMECNIQECLASFARIGVACCAELPGERMDIKDVFAELLAIKQKLSTFNIVI
ncbi:receptor kinase-like protein Xa21 [Neltuma alba]|uniref:receptor kinase-like protein Xa21 n=1 Tax=Neltuma alba TaxID=207710 RepID=UPI0010A54839|nr:receptor kinase-like protein Xa21 [Prosopis alba]